MTNSGLPLTWQCVWVELSHAVNIDHRMANRKPNKGRDTASKTKLRN